LIYAFGDIHGQVTMLQAMLKKLDALPLQSDDILLFVGDYVDRGEDSQAVIKTLLEVRARRPNTVFLRGNHEQLMLDARDCAPPEPGVRPGSFVLSDETILWFQNGGNETLLSYTQDLDDTDFLTWWEAIPETHWEFLRQTKIEHVTDRYHFVHAGLLPSGQTWEGQKTPAFKGLDPRLWIREPFLSSRHDFSGRIVVFGHTPQHSGKPLIRKNKIGIDTGAVFGGPLTVLGVDPDATGRKFPTPEFLQVSYALGKE
jgi:serine/threonine protein phosphatase 1